MGARALRAFAALSALGAAFAACGRGQRSVDAPLALVAPSASATAASASASAAPPPTPNAPRGPTATPAPATAPSLSLETFFDEVRAERFADAARNVEALAPDDRARPEARLAAARAFAAVGAHAAALTTLSGLERELPELGPEIAKMRVEALVEAGPPDEAARALASSPAARDRLRAALAWERAGKLDEARKEAERAISALRSTEDAALAHACRARATKAAGRPDLAAADARWLAVHAPTSEGARETAALLDGAPPFAASERVARATRLAEAGEVDRALAELSRADPAGTDAGLAMTRARLLYRARGRYADAAAAFSTVARRFAALRDEASFYAARSLSRADRDEEAAAGYHALARRAPRSIWADQATYLAARLDWIDGRFAEAARGYDTYLRRFPSGHEKRAARYERAIAWLASGRAADARRELAALAKEASFAADAARLHELEGVAALGAGDRRGATALFAGVVAASPRSFAGLAARARLDALGLGPARGPAPGDATTDAAARRPLPSPAAKLVAAGLAADAEAWLGSHLDAVAPKGKERTRALCEAFAATGRAARGFALLEARLPTTPASRPAGAEPAWAFACAYPTPYADVVGEVEAREKLPRGLVHAVMRQESRFDPAARSPARAVGLLQLLVPTAKAIADESGLPFAATDLATPRTNVDLGARYLAKLLRSFDGSVPLAVAAYNAGPRAVAKWHASARSLDVDVWVARIPYAETRAYVALVLSNLAAYRARLGAIDPGLDLALPTRVEVSSDAF